MNLKDRLIAPNKKNVYVKQKDDSEISDIFTNNEFVEDIISGYVSVGRNFLLTGSFDCDKSIVEKYIKKFEKDNTNINYCGEGIKGLNLIFENVIAGKSANMSSFDLELYNDLLNNIKLLMSVNMPNLKKAEIDYILKTVNPVIIHASKDEDGLFYIKNIGELTNETDELVIANIYPSEQDNEEEIYKENTVDSSPIVEELPKADKKEPSGEKKVNKYKLLKEKIHRKNSQ